MNVEKYTFEPQSADFENNVMFSTATKTISIRGIMTAKEINNVPQTPDTGTSHPLNYGVMPSYITIRTMPQNNPTQLEITRRDVAPSMAKIKTEITALSGNVLLKKFEKNGTEVHLIIGVSDDRIELTTHLAGSTKPPVFHSPNGTNSLIYFLE